MDDCAGADGKLSGGSVHVNSRESQIYTAVRWSKYTNPVAKKILLVKFSLRVSVAVNAYRVPCAFIGLPFEDLTTASTTPHMLGSLVRWLCGDCSGNSLHEALSGRTF